jgi:hypothetical protein
MSSSHTHPPTPEDSRPRIDHPRRASSEGIEDEQDPCADRGGTKGRDGGEQAPQHHYPLIDVVASLLDARSQHGSARELLLGDAAVIAVAAVALGVAATGSVADVLAVFGVWAAISGAAQLVVALRRRAQLGNQWPMLLAGGVSMIAGVAYIIAALNMLAPEPPHGDRAGRPRRGPAAAVGCPHPRQASSAPPRARVGVGSRT